MTLTRPELLRVERPVRGLAEQVAAAGGRLLIVGGWVRDGCLARTASDLDVELYDLDEAAALRVLRAAGLETIESVGRAFPVWMARGGDFAPFEVAIVDPAAEVDPARPFRERVCERARRRDLTVNAMALDPLRGEAFDEHGGMTDLRAHRLRAVDVDRFGEDPLRVLRVARFASWLEAEPDEALRACCRRQPLEGIAVERVRHEMDRLLASRRPSRGLRVLGEIGGLAALPELAALEGVPQDPEWHPEGCVWTHTRMVVDEAARLRTGDARRDARLMWGALLHDLGKATTTRVDGDRVRSAAHDAVGAEMSLALLGRLRAGSALAEGVAALVRHHLAPALLAKQASTDRAYRRLARRLAASGIDADLLHRVALADHLGRTTREALERRFPAGDAFVARMRALETLGGPPLPRVRGREVVAAGIAPGPEVGAVLERCEAIADETGWSDGARILERALRDHRAERARASSPREGS